MRKFAIALVAAITVGATLPAGAQVGFYAGPGGIGVGVGSPGYYGHGPRITITTATTLIGAANTSSAAGRETIAV
jgi:hypothetical protein